MLQSGVVAIHLGDGFEAIDSTRHTIHSTDEMTLCERVLHALSMASCDVVHRVGQDFLTGW
jgi:hypothetical protein